MQQIPRTTVLRTPLWLCTSDDCGGLFTTVQTQCVCGSPLVERGEYSRAEVAERECARLRVLLAMDQPMSGFGGYGERGICPLGRPGEKQTLRGLDLLYATVGARQNTRELHAFLEEMEAPKRALRPYPQLAYWSALCPGCGEGLAGFSVPDDWHAEVTRPCIRCAIKARAADSTDVFRPVDVPIGVTAAEWTFRRYVFDFSNVPQGEG